MSAKIGVEMKIQLIMENEEESFALRRYIKYCVSEEELVLSMYVYDSLIRGIPKSFVMEDPTLTIVCSHYEDMEYPSPHLRNFGLELLRLRSKEMKSILVLYEKFDSQLSEEWPYLIKIPWCNISLSTRIRQLIKDKIIPTDEQIKEIEKIYPPVKLDHRHHMQH